MIVQWWPDPTEPIASFHRALEKLSTCEVQILGTWIDRKQDLVPKLTGIDVVIWWNYKYDIEMLNKARIKFKDQVS